ncbi:uncharacterized protein METZ01_LOCUS484750, partial [marine metagenome]
MGSSNLPAPPIFARISGGSVTVPVSSMIISLLPVRSP